MSTPPDPYDSGGMLHPKLRAEHDPNSIMRDGRRLDHAEGTSKPLRVPPEPQPRGAKVAAAGRSISRRPPDAS